MHITLSAHSAGRRFARPRIPIFFFTLYQETQAFRCLQPFQVRLTASIVVGHATDREHVQVVFHRSKGR